MSGKNLINEPFLCDVYRNPQDVKPGTFFYIRDPRALNDVPQDQKKYFEAGDTVAKKKMDDLKNAVKRSGLPVYEYPAKWNSVVDGKPMVSIFLIFTSLCFFMFVSLLQNT